ncbi:hypothetical protein cypCar_00031403 [Cyprinus carpio]|nr:hypothetical protein cypCar_00031403 [Cyprinus carpio]
MWLFKRGDQTVRIAQMYQGYEPFYDKRLTSRVKMNPKTGALSIWNISSSDAGLYQVSLHSGSVSEKSFRVDVYIYNSNQAVKTRKRYKITVTCNHHLQSLTIVETDKTHESVSTEKSPAGVNQTQVCQDHCGVSEALVRLVLSGLLGITTVVFLVEHLRCCSSQRRAASV